MQGAGDLVARARALGRVGGQPRQRAQLAACTPASIAPRTPYSAPDVSTMTARSTRTVASTRGRYHAIGTPMTSG